MHLVNQKMKIGKVAVYPLSFDVAQITLYLYVGTLYAEFYACHVMQFTTTVCYELSRLIAICKSLVQKFSFTS